MLSLEVRKKSGEAEVRRVTGALVTIGASSGNTLVVRARGVSGRHARIVEKDGGYFLDVFRGVEPVYVNGRETGACPIGIGDRISIGEAAITLLNGRPAGRATPSAELPVAAPDSSAGPRLTPSAGVPTQPVLSEAEYRGLRIEAYRKLKRGGDSTADELLEWLAAAFGLDGSAIGRLDPDGGFHVAASRFADPFQLPPSAAEDLKRAMGPLRVEGNPPLVFIATPARGGERKLVLAAEEAVRLPSRAAAFLEEVLQMADLAWSVDAVEKAGASAPPAPAPAEIVGVSDAMRRIVLDLPRIAQSKAPVLISGEVGTGKDLVAAAIHRESEVAAGPFVVVDCAAGSRVEEDLFGRPSGPGRTDRRRAGRIEEAGGGTLVLAEVGELPPAVQARLFDAIASASLADSSARVDVRWIATTSSSLLPAVESGAFRRDLYFRLAVLTVRLPSLAERPDDVPALFEHFVRRHAPAGLGPIEPDALNALLTYRYPGNARELENEVRRLAAVSGPTDPVTLDRLDARFREAEAGVVLHETDDLKRIVESVERQVIDRVMRKVEGNQSRGAELMNISRGSLIAKMGEYGIRDYRYLRRERKKGAVAGEE